LAIPALALAGGTDWMGGIDGSVRLSQLTIPGSHDAGARFEPIAGTTKCQEFTLAEQMNFGVRFLDIRCRHVKDAFAIYHGSADQKLSFAGVLRQVAGFLAAHPSECVILSVKEEHTAVENTRSFPATFDAYVAAHPAQWWLGTQVPDLNGVRGKVVLFRRFRAAAAKGIDASHWPDNTGFAANGLSVQDWYRVPDNATKWDHVTNALATAFAETNANVLQVNFTSGYKPGFFGIPSIPAVSDYIQPRLADYFRRARRGHYGCVLMDFADRTRSELIYNANAFRSEL
jgi:1-phosphatidylinositol phosphodiesterase